MELHHQAATAATVIVALIIRGLPGHSYRWFFHIVRVDGPGDRHAQNRPGGKFNTGAALLAPITSRRRLMAKPVLLVTRKLPEAIEARAAQDYDARLNPQDAPW